MSEEDFVRSEEFHRLRDNVRDLQHLLIGIDGKNGIRGTLAEIKKEHKITQDQVQDRLNKLELRLATYVGVGCAVVWLSERFL